MGKEEADQYSPLRTQGKLFQIMIVSFLFLLIIHLFHAKVLEKAGKNL